MTSPNSAKKEFINGLTSSPDHSLSVRDKFRDMMELGYCAFAKLSALATFDQERADELEARYMSIVNRYQNKGTVRSYKPLLDIAWETIECGGIDFLGEVSSELETLDARNGQFFTPFTVSTMMAEMMFPSRTAEIETEGYVTLEEPACGSGGTILAFADALQRAGYNPMLHMLARAVDVSPLCYYMAYLQLTWRGIPALVIRGNSLSRETFEFAWTVHTIPFRSVHGTLFEKGSRAVTPQLSFFDFA